MSPTKRSESMATLVREQLHGSTTSALAPTGDTSGRKDGRSASLRQQQLQIQQQPPKSHSHKGCCGSPYHLNSVWSVWYGLCIALFTGYLVYCSVKRFLYYASLPWREDNLPLVELNAFVGLVGSSVVVLPFFLLTSILKVGNLANDGFKLGASLSTCSRDLPPVLEPTHGLIRSLFLHGLPTAAFLHLVAAFCLLLPRTVMDATLIGHNMLPQENIWRSDIDFLFQDILHTYEELSPKRKLALEGSSQSTTFENKQQHREGSKSMQPLTKDINELINHLITPSTLPTVASLENKTTQKIRISRETSERNESKIQTSVHEIRITPSARDKTEAEGTEHPEGRIEAFFEESVTKPGLLKHFASPEGPEGFVEARISRDGRQFSTSLELVNYVIALFVFTIRYPSVFWHTNKGFALLFSLQLIINALHSIILLMAYTVMYKVHASGESSVILVDEAFLLSLPTTVTLQISAILIITISASAIYFYGYQKFAEFIIKSRQRYHISYSKATPILNSWSPHCCILAVVTGLSLVNGPLMWDMMHLYWKTSHTLLLAAIMSSMAHMLSWVFLWMILGFKSTWTFKLRVSVARACVSSARSIKLVNDVELSSWNDRNSLLPLLVVGGGKAYAIADSQPRKKIMAVIHKTQEDKRARGEEEDIYWLRSSQTQQHHDKPVSPKPKVTFEEDRKIAGNAKYSENPYSRVSKSHQQLTSASDTDEEDVTNRDYALLKKSSAAPSIISTHHSENRRHPEQKKILRHHRSMENYYSEDHKSISSISPLPKRLESKIGSPASIGSRDSRMSQEEQRWYRSNSISSSSDHQPQFSEDAGVQVNVNDLIHNRSNSVDDLTMLPPDPNLLIVSQRCMSLQRPISTLDGSIHRPISSLDISLPVNVNNSTPVLYPANEQTLVIRRQRNAVQEVKPPMDPIYGTRSLSSFTNRRQSSGIRGSIGSQGQPRESFYGSHTQEPYLGYESNSQPHESVYGIQIHPAENVYTTKSQANDNVYESKVNSSLYEPQRRSSHRHNKHLMCEGQGTHNSRRSTGSSGYHSGANGSSASNSSSNSPVPPPPPTQHLRQNSYVENSHIKQDIYGQIAHLTSNINASLNSNNPYMKHNMYEQIPHSNSNVSLSNTFSNPQLRQEIYGQLDSQNLERSGTRNSHIFNGHISNQPLPDTPDLPLPPVPQELLAQETVEPPHSNSNCYDIYGRTTGQKIYG
ncbi:unnamed protein product [Meganyctiphanes norvegica]|uniref:Protein tincar n=1 Tax=Meganyctiphanes norvegica TaxID=48144 RepID=A0AAV2RWJ7_MEGNR